MKKKNSKKKLIVISSIVLVLVIIVVVLNRAGKAASNSSEGYKGIQVQKYDKHDLSTTINVSGKVESQNVLDVTTELSCKVKELKVSLGDYVEKDSVLLVFDDTEIREQINELESQISESDKLAAKELEIANRELQSANDEGIRLVKNATDAVSKAQTEYNNAVDAYNKLSDDVEKEIAYQEMKQAESSLNEANINLENVKISTQQAIQNAQDAVDLKSVSGTRNSEVTKQLSKLYRQLDGVTVTAGQSGIITALNVSQGSIPNGVLMKIEDNNNLKIKVTINEKDITKLNEGMEAVIKSDALPDESYTGKVNRVINFASAIEGSSMFQETETGYGAEVLVENGSKFLLGMSAKVEIKANDIGEKLSVPYDSVVEEDNPYVYKAEKNGDKYKVVKVNVTVGEKNDYYTEITSPELKEGDLIISYPDMVDEGSAIDVHISEND